MAKSIARSINNEKSYKGARAQPHAEDFIFMFCALFMRQSEAAFVKLLHTQVDSLGGQGKLIGACAVSRATSL